MIVLITGGSGNLGRELVKLYPDSLHPTHQELDLTSLSKISKYIDEYKPNIFIHLAALTDVRECEQNKKKAWRNNVIATENIIDACYRYLNSYKSFFNFYFLYMSTACVFRGDRGDYTEIDIPYPDNFYSLTKLIGEFIVKRLKNYLIIRANFVPREKWKYEKAFTDRFGTYLFADDLALAIKDVVDKKLTGIVHIVGEEKLSMFELAKITTPDIKPMTMNEVDLPLPCDMSLRSLRIKPYKISRTLR